MSEKMQFNTEKKNFVDRLLPSKSLRRGVFYIGVSALALVYVADHVVDRASGQVADGLKPTIIEQGANLQTGLKEQTEPSKQDIEEFTKKADTFFADYDKFKTAVCKGGLQMEGCVEILAKEEERTKKSQESDQAAGLPVLPSSTTTTVTASP